MISKEMLKRCQNELKQAFCALPDDVREILIENRENHVEYLSQSEKWTKWEGSRAGFFIGWTHFVFRLSPDTPTEPEWEENRVGIDNRGHYEVRLSNGEGSYLFAVVTYSYFIGIIYQKDGIETLRTSIDAAFGTPVRVRFLKP